MHSKWLPSPSFSFIMSPIHKARRHVHVKNDDNTYTSGNYQSSTLRNRCRCLQQKWFTRQSASFFNVWKVGASFNGKISHLTYPLSGCSSNLISFFSLCKYQHERSKHNVPDKSWTPFVPTFLTAMTRNLIWKCRKHLSTLGFMYMDFSANVRGSRKTIFEEELPLTKVGFWFSLTLMLLFTEWAWTN